jgi:formimidoylglutamase
MPEPTSGRDPLEGFRARSDPRDPRAAALLRPHHRGESLEGAAVLVGCPYDGGIPSRPGARFGPRALREALSAFGIHDGERDLPAVTDLGDLGLPGMNAGEAHHRIEGAARAVFEAGARPIFLGGDHGVTGSLVRGFAAARPEARLALISLDAHLDVREYEDRSSLSSGTPFRRALETGVLAGPRTAMIGLRPYANSTHYLEWARGQGVRLYGVEDVEELGPVEVARRAVREVVQDADCLYLSIDLDVADAAVAPGVSAPGTGGLTARELIALVAEIAGVPTLVGADVMELSPPLDEGGRTARLGARLLLELLRRAA